MYSVVSYVHIFTSHHYLSSFFYYRKRQIVFFFFLVAVRGSRVFGTCVNVIASFLFELYQHELIYLILLLVFMPGRLLH